MNPIVNDLGLKNEAWRSIGRFDFNGHGDFWTKHLPEEPGLYRLKFAENIYYVGQAKSIHRRLGDYYRPGQGIEGDHRIYRALQKFNGAEVEVMTGSEYANVSFRRKRETVEIESLRALGRRVLNGNCIDNLSDRIEYHNDEINKLKKQITMLATPKTEEQP